MTKKKKDAIPRATHQGDLVLGDASITCAVLEDGTRLLSQGGFLKAIGRSRTPKAGSGATVAEVPPFLAAKNLKPYIGNELVASTTPIKFRDIGGRVAHGYAAEVLPQVCEVFLRARDDKPLLGSQAHIAKQCDIVMRGLAHVGIIALVDEATGYQEVRARKDLERILERFISKELLKWAKTFPDEFYEHLFRLRGWQYVPLSVKRPSYVGKLTNDLVYERLAPGVLEELQQKNPRKNGRRKHKHFQWLTDDYGSPRLKEHLNAVIVLMKASSSWPQFYRLIQRALPRHHATLELRLYDDKGEPI